MGAMSLGDEDPAFVPHAPRAAWQWLVPRHPRGVVTFLLARHVEEVFLGVPWSGPDAGTALMASALHAAGIRVSALGGDPSWAREARLAGVWADRLGTPGAHGLFDGVHLDIEPWADPATWRGHERERLDGVAEAVAQVRAARPGLPVEVDLAPWLASEHPAQVREIARASDGVVIMAYRDRTTAILATSAPARRLLARAGRPYRVGVNTLLEDDLDATFFDDGRAVMRHEVRAAEAALGEDVWFRGVAVHTVAGWRALRP